LTISTNKLQVEALGIFFYNVALKKDISLLAFNGLPDVTISNFMFPSDDPIHIETDTDIPSPPHVLLSVAKLDIDLGTVEFLAYFQNVVGHE
jgi:hypothetical protein